MVYIWNMKNEETAKSIVLSVLKFNNAVNTPQSSEYYALLEEVILTKLNLEYAEQKR